MGQHTPGPWEVARPKDGSVIIQQAVKSDVGMGYNTVYDSAAPDVFPMSEEDAALIAAAPDLLAACKAMMESIETRSGRETSLLMAIAAIAKATA